MQGKVLDQAQRTLEQVRIEQDQEEDRDRHAEGDVDVGGRHNLHVRDADELGELRNPVDGHQVHEVHQEHPDEDRQAERRNEPALAVKGVLDRGIHEFDDEFHGGLPLGGLADRGPPGDPPEAVAKDQPEEHRPEHRVDVDRHRVAGALVPHPLAGFGLADLQVLQMVGNVVAGSLGTVSAFTCHSFYSFSFPCRAASAGRRRPSSASQ